MTDGINVIGFCASPRQGNSDFLLDKALESASAYGRAPTKINRFLIGRKPLAPCDACGAHKALKGECRIKDSFQEVRDLWLDADVVIYSFPVYHMGIPAQLKSFLDRLGNSLGFYFQKEEPRTYQIPRLMKTMGFITQGAHLYGGQDLALSYMLNHALLMRCIPVPGDLPDSYIGAGGWTGGQPGEKSLQELFEQGDRDALLAVKSARQVVRRALETALILKAGLVARKRILAGDQSYGFVLEKLSGP
jgi:multimeric flavodoxin WrbA